MRFIIAHDYTQNFFAANSHGLAQLLVAQGHEVLFFSHRPAMPAKHPATYESLTVLGWPEKRPVGWRSFWYLFQHIRRFRPHAIVVHFAPQNIVGLASRLLGGSRKVVYYHTTTAQINQDFKGNRVKLRLLRLRKQ
jgi:UDP:flavonoid glycosyltransferase YjiC (YdhE family)